MLLFFDIEIVTVKIQVYSTGDKRQGKAESRERERGRERERDYK